MAATRFSEEESGFYTIRVRHPHNGYYAGDFSRTALFATELWPTSPDRPGVPPPGHDPGHLTGVSELVRVHAGSTTP